MFYSLEILYISGRLARQVINKELEDQLKVIQSFGSLSSKIRPLLQILSVLITPIFPSKSDHPFGGLQFKLISLLKSYIFSPKSVCKYPNSVFLNKNQLVE